MDKNSIIGLVLIAAIFAGFTFYQSKLARRQAALQAQADSIALANAGEAFMDSVAEGTDINEAAAAVGARSMYKDSTLQKASQAVAQIVKLENERLSVEFTSKGAQPYSVQVKDYYNYDSTALYIFKPGDGEYSVSVYTGEYIQTKDFNFELSELDSDHVVFRLPFDGGGYIEQRYTLLPDSYRVDSQLSFVGLEGVIPRKVGSFDLDFTLTLPRMEKGYKNETQYSKLDYYFEGDKKPSEMGKARNSSKRIDSRLSWFAFQQQFFCAIMRAPEQFNSGELSIDFFQDSDPERRLMTCKASMRNDLTPGVDTTVPFEFYFGPNHYKTLKSFGHKYEKIIPLGGWLVSWISKGVIIPMFDFFSRFLSNFGLIILLMTVVIKIVVFPLNYKSLASAAKMTALKPEIEKINAKFPNTDNQQDQLKKQQATMALYKRAGVSPMGGCLPMLLTFPVLWAMFRFFPASIELRQQSFLWCHDLSAYDSIIDYGVKIPILGDHLSLFALLMAATMWGYAKLTMASQPSGNDPTAKSMKFMNLWMMPIMMFFICNSLSAALSYYYLISQLISIAMTWIIRKSIDPQKVLAKVRASEGKPLPKSKWQQRLEEAQKMQEEQMRKQQKRR